MFTRPLLVLTTFAAAIALGPATAAFAHCDTVDGPVAADVRAAVAAGDATPILKWVAEADEAAVRAAFDHARQVRALGDAAGELADRWLLETVVRIHRAGEGAPFSGLKPAGSVEPAIALADTALASGSAEALTDALTEHVARVVEARVERAVAARTKAAESVAAGRAYVAAYVELMHTVEGLEAALGDGHDEHAAAACGTHPGGEEHDEPLPPAS